MKIFIRDKDKQIDDWEEITDLYFFEEQMIHSFIGIDHHDNHYEYKFVIEYNDKLYSPENKLVKNIVVEP